MVNMKRVSSRQRLVSWDKFDASAPEHRLVDEADYEISCKCWRDNKAATDGLSRSNSSSRLNIIPHEVNECSLGACSEIITVSKKRYRAANEERTCVNCYLKVDRLATEISLSSCDIGNAKYAVNRSGLLPELDLKYVSPISRHTLPVTDFVDHNEDTEKNILSMKNYMTDEINEGMSSIQKPNVNAKSSQKHSTIIVDDSELEFNDINDDTKLQVLSFLNASEIRLFSTTNTVNLTLCRIEHLWLDMCIKKWAFVEDIHQKKENSLLNYKFVLKSNGKTRSAPPSPTRAAYRMRKLSLFRKQKAKDPCQSSVPDSSSLNFSILHGLTRPHPFEIDKKFFNEDKASLNNQQNVTGSEFQTFKMKVTTKCHKEIQKVSAIKLMKGFGGDRSIRSSQPFPHVCSPSKKLVPSKIASKILGRGRGYLTSSPSKMILESKLMFGMPTMKPFVFPIVSNIKQADEQDKSTGMVELNVTPRLVAYYEVSLLACEEENESSSSNLNSLSMRTISDCVAVGLSTENFDCSTKMPGWDEDSYGYHSDDGGFFHSQGSVLHKYGPKFGVGDTVGCGIDYAKQSIFFTLNGRDLGSAWSGTNLKKEFYPTVGIDSRHPISFNFGSTPFTFNLQEYSDRHSQLIDKAILHCR